MKIYYLKSEVSIGDQIVIDGFKVEITEELIKLNPDKFEVKEESRTAPRYYRCLQTAKDFYIVGKVYPVWGTEQYPHHIQITAECGNRAEIMDWDISYASSGNSCFEPATEEEWKKWMLGEAARRFPIGTEFKSKPNGCDDVATVAPWWTDEDPWCIAVKPWGDGGAVWMKDSGWDTPIEKKILFTTEDGVDIREGDKSYIIYKNSFEISGPTRYHGDNPESYYYFSTLESAQEFVKKNNPKTLEDYEEMFCSPHGFRCSDGVVCQKSGLYARLKEVNPKLYWLGVLQTIADDLNERVYSDDKDYRNISIDLEEDGNYRPEHWISANSGKVLFANVSTAQKAINIMGNKLDIIYKS